MCGSKGRCADKLRPTAWERFDYKDFDVNSLTPSHAPERLSSAEACVQATERERERVRQVLHDGLGQLLTSISFLAGSLKQKLEQHEMPEAEEAAEIIALTSKAIGETQRLAYGPPSEG